MNNFLEEINFPYSSVREGQEEFLRQVYQTITNAKNLMVQAPTGLGKTVSALAPAIKQAKEKGLTVVCLTSRQTQANQIIKTIKDINSVSKESINFTAFIGKRSMCTHKDKDLYPAQDFNDFCKKMRETGKCSFYKNTKNSDYQDRITDIIKETSKSFLDVEGFVNFVSSPVIVDENRVSGFCPYELAGKKAFKSDVVICDFNYLFSSGIRDNFLGKIGRSLEECILVVDEAHNLPDRIRNSNSHVLNSEGIKNAHKELRDFVKSSQFDHYILNLKAAMDDIYINKVLGTKTEHSVTKDEFIDLYLSKFESIERLNLKKIIEKLEDIEALVKEDRVISFVGRIASFLTNWKDLDEDIFFRSLEKKVGGDKTIISLKIRCLDPSEVATSVVNNTYSSILMSGTLSPINMYRDLLGIANCNILELESPFSRNRQLTIVLNDVTTKYSARSSDMFKKIANHVETLINAAEDKNSIIFFQSYDLMEKIISNINLIHLNRKILREQRYMTKEDKEKFVDEFKSGFSMKSKALFAITGGSFGEGLDLPDDALEMVIIVGLPLGVPDLYTNAVIKHYDRKFGKGQLYGYVNPAMSKIVQAAGRCIRTENDRGVIALLDNRFLWPLYAQSLPEYWKLKKTENPIIEIGNFFK